MSVDSAIEMPLSKPNTLKKGQAISRRGFLKLAGLSLAALTGGGLVKFYEKNPLILDQVRLAVDTVCGDFRSHRIKGTRNLADFVRNSKEYVWQSNDAIQASHILIQDKNNNHEGQQEIVSGDVHPDFPVASIIKIPACIEAFRRGEREGIKYLTEHDAIAILKYSDNDVFKQLIRKMCYKEKISEEEGLRRLIKELGIEAKNTQGQLPLRIDMKQLFNYLYQIEEFPEIIRQAMKLEKTTVFDNFGVNQVVHEILDNPKYPPTYFKIGLVDTQIQENDPHENFFCNFYARCGSIQMLGYGWGTPYAVIRQMLTSMSMMAIYVRNKPENYY